MLNAKVSNSDLQFNLNDTFTIGQSPAGDYARCIQCRAVDFKNAKSFMTTVSSKSWWFTSACVRLSRISCLDYVAEIRDTSRDTIAFRTHSSLYDWETNADWFASAHLAVLARSSMKLGRSLGRHVVVPWIEILENISFKIWLRRMHRAVAGLGQRFDRRGSKWIWCCSLPKILIAIWFWHGDACSRWW